MSGSVSTSYSITHDSWFDYESSINGCTMLVRLQPREDRGQSVESFSVSSDPETIPVACGDSFSNSCHMFSIHRRFRRIHVRSESVVHTDPAPVVRNMQELSAQLTWADVDRHSGWIGFWDYLAPSRFVRPGKAFDAFVERYGLRRGPDPVGTLQEACSILNRHLVYTQGSSTVDSPVDHIAETGEGVCQDYAHLMLALGRSWGIPSRYVSGYLYLEEMPEVASHAWAEFWLPEIGWVGLDATNDAMADHRFIRVAQGRDYADAAPTRGVVYGGGEATVKVDVRVEALPFGLSNEAPMIRDGQSPIRKLPWQGEATPAPSVSLQDQ